MQLPCFFTKFLIKIISYFVFTFFLIIHNWEDISVFAFILVFFDYYFHLRMYFPPGVFQTSPKYSNLYFDLSKGDDARGPWNEGESTQLKEQWQYIEQPLEEVRSTDGLLDRKPEGTDRSEKEIARKEAQLSKECSGQVLASTPKKEMSWCKYQ